MITVRSEGIVLERTENEYENQAVLNPACIEVGGATHMYYRAVSKDFVSSIGYCILHEGGIIERRDKPLLFPELEYEKRGVEDPRIVRLDGTYYLFYTVYDGKNALIAYATSQDLVNFKKQKVISPTISYEEAGRLMGLSHIREKYLFFESYIRDRAGRDILVWEKDAFIFPRKINGRFALVHRILPGIQVIYFDDFSQLSDTDYWKSYLKDLGKYVLLDPKYDFESRNIGGGCPPIETEEGWLFIYHAVEDCPGGRVYHAAAALFDLNNPMRLIGRLSEPLFSPCEEWEKVGDVNNVVFPTGAVIREGRLHIYYGAADRLIAAKSVDLRELLHALKNNK